MKHREFYGEHGFGYEGYKNTTDDLAQVHRERLEEIRQERLRIVRSYMLAVCMVGMMAAAALYYL